MFKRLSLGGVLLVLCAGCAPDISLGWGCFDYCPPPFGVAPNDIHLLRGDTITFYAWECSGLFCGTEPNAWTKWSISGSAAVAVTASGTSATSVAAATHILVRGEAAGVSTVVALVGLDTAKTVRRLVTVADSTVITSIAIAGFGAEQDTIFLGQGIILMNLALKDAAGNQYSARPTDWFVGDTTVIALDGPALRPPAAEWVQQKFRPKAAGYATVTIKFLDVSRTLTMRVVP